MITSLFHPFLLSETGVEACCDITFSANTLAAPQKQILVKGKAIYRLVKG